MAQLAPSCVMIQPNMRARPACLPLP